MTVAEEVSACEAILHGRSGSSAVLQAVPAGQRPALGENPDTVLLSAVAEGDEGALRALYDRHAPWLILRLVRRCSDRAVVDEVVQDSFLAVWKGAGRYRGEGEVAAWIWSIAIRRLIAHLRRRPAPTAVPEVHGTTVVQSAEETVLTGVEFGDLAGSLNQLSPELRAVVRATVLDGLTTREAARLLGIPAGTVKTRLMRARAQMREALT